MKRRGRRRKPYVEIIPHRPGFMYDPGSDLYLPVNADGQIIPRMKISHAQREAIGEELAKLRLARENPADPELVEKITAFLLKPRPGLETVTALMQARDYYAVVVENGYSQYQSYVDWFDRELDSIRQIIGGQASPPLAPDR